MDEQQWAQCTVLDDSYILNVSPNRSLLAEDTGNGLVT